MSRLTTAPWLGALKAEGRARFEALGLPSTKAEAWRYFPTRALRGVDLGAAGPEASALDADHIAALRLPGTIACAVFVDGRFSAERSDLAALPAGVTIGSLAAALAADPERVRAHLGAVAPSEGAAMVAANEAWFDDGLWVDVPANAAVEGPVEVLFVTTEAAGPATHPRNVLVLGRSAELTLVFGWSGPAGRAYATNAVTEIALGDNATLRLANVEDEGDGATHVHHLQARQGRDSTLKTFSLSLGGEAARTSVRAELGAPGASCHLDGLYLAGGKQRLDHYTEVDHQAPHTQSRQYYGGVIDDRAVGNYIGLVFIREGASKTDAQQLNKNLLLAPTATANAKPSLEIDHDDVKASHGTTVGQLDEKSLFYLLSRGISPEDARGILILAFAQDALARLGEGAHAQALVHRVAAKLGAEAVLEAEEIMA
ncbi:MAG: Fe-S cluster assembly protein SufD [Deltaproteobacteria bacterium]|nr:MAG: Fe-S cluster assembly protein SufD [Deltaproteobacteria bacterium]